MATVTVAQEKKGKEIVYDTLEKMYRVLNYINNLKKTEPELRGGVFLNNPDKAYDEFMLVKNLWNKQDKGKRKCIHLIQSFAPGESNPKEVKEIAEQFVKHKQFNGFQISYAVHLDTHCYHTHYIINTVNAENGYMWQMSKNQLQTLKDFSDDLCRERGLSVVDNSLKKDKVKSPAQKAAEQKGKSWKKETQLAVDEAMKIAVSRADFISIMKMQGYGVRWDYHKYINFTNPKGKMMRNRLFDNPERYTKEVLEKRFEENRRQQKTKTEEVVENDLEEKSEQDIDTPSEETVGANSGGHSEEKQDSRTDKTENGKEDFSHIRRETFYAVRDAKNVAVSREDFISILNCQGYSVTWDEHKYITFQKTGHRAVRNRNFYPREKYTKEALLEKFEKNRQKLENIRSGKYQKQEMNEGERVRGDMLYLLTHIFSGNHGAYPHQDRIRERSLAELEDWQKEQEKGKGMDWEQ